MRVKKSLILHIFFIGALISLVFLQLGCPPPPRYYVVVPGDRVQINPNNVKNVTALTTSLPGEKIYSSVSPDGKHVAFVYRPYSSRNIPFLPDIRVMDAETGLNLEQITQTQKDQEVYWPSWWKGADRLLYTRYDGYPDYYRNLYFHYYPGQMAEGYQVLPREANYIKGGGWIEKGTPSPDGKKIAISMETGENRKAIRNPFRRLITVENPIIWIYDVETKLSSYFTNGQEPAWSPDGKKIAFSRREEDHCYIYVKDVDGKSDRRLTYGPASWDIMPCWSPSGTEIAFSSFNSGDYDIWKIKEDGTNSVQLTTAKGTEWWPSWGPGGQVFYSFYHNVQGWEIYRLQLQPK